MSVLQTQIWLDFGLDGAKLFSMNDNKDNLIAFQQEFEPVPYDQLQTKLEQACKEFSQEGITMNDPNIQQFLREASKDVDRPIYTVVWDEEIVFLI